jgi:beta-ribofuranosylaminobenzene 5'-phosphate synthase
MGTSSIRVTTATRLHFGLLRLPPSPDWRDDGTRYFGGAGLMIDTPSVIVRVERAREWSAAGPLADRARSAAARYLAAIDSDARFSIHIESAPPEHVGLGTGTQLELAVASGLSRLLGRSDDAVAIAQILGRGRRSGVGVHGFAAGGFLIDRGKRQPDEIAAVERLPFPIDWPIVVVTPPITPGWFGNREWAAFASLGPRADSSMENLLDAAIVALRARDLATFGAALTEYNARAGEVVRPLQGGRYADPIIEELVNGLLVNGTAAAGQSSWGPTAFGIVGNEYDAERVLKWVSAKSPEGSRVHACRACDFGAQFSTIPI